MLKNNNTKRMHAQLERNRLIQSQEQARKLFDQIEREKERILAENESLRKEIEVFFVLCLFI